MSIVVEFSGTPDAGKTTVLNSLFSEFKNQGKSVILLDEANGEKLPPHNLRGSLAYNVVIFSSSNNYSWSGYWSMKITSCCYQHIVFICNFL